MTQQLPIKIEFTRDWRTVWDIVTDTSVFARICDDAWVEKPLYELMSIVRGIVLNGDNHVPLVWRDGRAVGCFLICAMGGGDFEVHTCLTRAIRGAAAVEGAAATEAEKALVRSGARRAALTAAGTKLTTIGGTGVSGLAGYFGR